ncbi:MAG: SurA N-terminal domain-containing protein [Opitutales bacterium]|jgi:hypothetical protein
MITWIQTRFQKHFKWLFMALLVVMVVTFVLTIGNQSFFGTHSDNRLKSKDFYGYNLASENTSTYLEQAARLSAYISPELQQEVGADFTIERYSRERAVALSLARALGIAEPSTEQLREYVRTKPVFLGEDGKFSAKTYKDFMAMMETAQRVPESTLVAIMTEDFRITKVRELIGGAGFIDPDMLAVEMQAYNTEWTFDLAQIPFDTFKPEVQTTPEGLKKYFDDNQARFEIPEKIQFTQVRFPAVSYIAGVDKPTEEQVQSVFERNKARYAPAPVRNEDGTVAAEQPEAVLDDATRARIVQDIVMSQALQAAAQKADEYTLALWREEVPADSPRVLEMAKSMGAQINPVQPYSRNNPPRVSDLTQTQLAAQWTLAVSERYFSDVIPGNDAASVLIFNGTIPARMPAYDEVSVQVSDAYVASRRAAMFVEHGNELQKSLADAVAQGIQFTQAAKALGLVTETHEKITMANVPQELGTMGGPMDVISRMEPGRVSQMQVVMKGGFIAFLQDKTVPTLESLKATPEQLEVVRISVASTDGWSILGALTDKRLAELEAELKAGPED